MFGESWEFLFEIERAVVLAGGVEKLSDFPVEVAEGPFELARGWWLFTDCDFFEGDFVFTHPLRGFAAGVAGFEGVNFNFQNSRKRGAESGQTGKLETPSAGLR